MSRLPTLPYRLFATVLLFAPLASVHAATCAVGASNDGACSHHSLAATIAATSANGPGTPGAPTPAHRGARYSPDVPHSTIRRSVPPASPP